MIKTTYTKSKKTYKVTFELSSDQVGSKRDVRVLGSFNDWSWDGGLTMKETKGKYSASTELPSGEYKFRYLADGHDWKNDDSADQYTDSGYGTTNCCFSLEAKNNEPTKKTAAKKSSSKTSDSSAKDAKKADTKTSKAGKSEKSATKANPDTKGKSSTKNSTGKKGSKKDDFKKIEGIGPKIMGLLNDAGITTFTQLHKATDKKLADVLQAAGARFRLAKPSTWKEQAGLAAAGKMEELKKLQDKLDGGVRK